jgi:hypothetical protein
MKAYEGVDVLTHIFLTSALVGGEWSASRPGRFIHGERAPGTYWIGGWVNPGAGLDNVEKRELLTLPGLELRPLGCPAHSQSLYRLRTLHNFSFPRLFGPPPHIDECHCWLVWFPCNDVILNLICSAIDSVSGWYRRAKFVAPLCLARNQHSTG